ncbi:MAG: hypothetical protein WEB58_14210 [Planctomycetaceae bacterium]
MSLTLAGVEYRFGFAGHRTRARCLTGLPCYDGYGLKPTVAHARALTFTGISLIETETTPDVLAKATSVAAEATAEPPRVRYFALAQEQIAVEHCVLSRASLILWSNGHWELFVRAEQNPNEPSNKTPAGTAVALRPLEKPTTYLKRNEFHVVAKGFGASQTMETKRVAQPVLFHRAMKPFWVERGQPREVIFSGDLDAAQDFDLINRFEIEFAYR